jgi:hypothetical protein
LHDVQPVVDHAVTHLAHGRTDATAAVVSADHDVAHIEHLHRVLDHREGVQIVRVDLIGDVAVHEHFARLRPRDGLARDSRVMAANEQEVRLLDGRAPLEVLGIVGSHRLGPPTVVLEQLLIQLHAQCPPLEGAVRVGTPTSR